MSDLKIVHSYKIYRPDIDGGIPFVIATLTRPMEDVENAVLVARRRGFSQEYKVDQVPVEAVGSFGTLLSTPLAPLFPSALLRRARSCDIIVHHAPFPLADIVIPWLPANVGLIVYWHADIVGFSLLKTLITPAINGTLKRADRIIVADQSTLDSSPVLHPYAEKCRIIPYGADIDYWESCTEDETAEADRLRQQYPRMVLAIGRLVPYKGFGVLLEALQHIDAQVIIVGEGPLEQELKGRADQLGVSAKVQFAGRLSATQMKAHIHAARLLAFPSLTAAEAFGIVQLEAMAAGLPVVNTALETAVPHIARHDQEALTVPINDPRALATAARQILDDPELRQRLGQAGQLRARQEYSREIYRSRIKDIYSEVLQARGHRSLGQ